MSYRFFATSVETLKREGERRAKLAAKIEAKTSRIRRGRPPEKRSRRALLTQQPSRLPAHKSIPAPPKAAIIALTRLGFGPTLTEVADFDGLAGSDAARLQAWVDQQLDPASIDDSAADARIAQSNFTTLNKSLEQLWADHVVPENLTYEERVRPLFEVRYATFLRAIHSRRQLFEVMVDFWHNHFNVYAHEDPWASTWPHTDRDAIRPNALGNFRQMLEAVAKTPSMLLYLNNAVNSFEDANENYGRELMELHTLGAAAYYGSIPQSQVPVDGQGNPMGYVEDDVISAARCLTGWTLRDRPWNPDFGNTGSFFYYAPDHDNDPKHIIGVDLPANQPAMKDGRDLLDILAQHPSTGRHVATKMVRRLIGDSPPASVVAAAAAVFTAQHAAPDQIAQVVRTIVLSPEFLTTWADKVKRPFEIVTSAFRGVGADIPFEVGEPATDWFDYVYEATGQPLFEWHPPNGFPDVKPAWNSTSPRVMSWRLANSLLAFDDAAGNYFLDAVALTPPGVRSARAIVDFWVQRMLSRPTTAQEEAELISFMAQGHNPDFDLPVDADEDTADRIRSLVSLIIQSPSFLWR